MGKISVQSSEEKSIYNSVNELEEEFQVEKRIDELNIKVNGLTPIIFDDEIGLWEELESRYGRRAQISRASR